jgi:hypothetical protein
MGRLIKILLQTTIPTTDDDWSIARFSLLGRLLREYCVKDAPAFEITMRDRDPLGAPDSLLSNLDRSEFDQLWLFAVDTGHGLTAEDCDGITRFRRAGHGLLVTRDHMDLGSSVCTLGGVGLAHHFHSLNVDSDSTRREVDDPYTTTISWPNFHSGANGDYQQIRAIAPIHAVLSDPNSPTGVIRYLPSHPHEGDVSAPVDQEARVIAMGASKVTKKPFNIAVAFEPSAFGGPAIAQSTFHHFADYNWDPRSGSPSFVTEPPGDAIARDPQPLADTHQYVLNVAAWLSGQRGMPRP